MAPTSRFGGGAADLALVDERWVASPPPVERRGPAVFVESHVGCLVVLAAYAGAMLLIPTLAGVAVSDDWVYYRAVETLLTRHVLQVPEMSSAALVFQTLWGAAFAGPLGLSFGALRVSTIVLVGSSGIAVYALCRELGVSRPWSSVTMAAYLFHPLTLALTYTFMTDPHFVALLVLATWLYVRGLRAGGVDARFVVAGSVVSACALLVRQQGILIPLGVSAALLLGRQLQHPETRQSAIVRLLRVNAIPLGTLLAYTLWLRYVNGTPWALSLFWTDIESAGPGGILTLLPRLAVIEAVYVGMFVLPLAVSAAVCCVQPIARLNRASIVAAGGWAVLVVGGTLWLGQHGETMPYAGQFVTSTGLGPEDLIAARPVLMGSPVRVGLTIACAFASLILGVLVSARLTRGRRVMDGGVGVVLGIGLGQVLGTLPPSVHFIPWAGTLDRYLLPLLPLGLVMLVWGMRRLPSLLPLACAAVLAMGVWSVAGTRDHLVFLDSVWSMAGEANTLGVPNNRLDAGAAWDAFHLYEHPPRSDSPPRTPNPPWWIDMFAPATDSSYVVAGALLAGYTQVEERTYWSWLRWQTLPVYLLRRPDVAGPP